MKIISGGQTGADRGGLDAAIELGIDHGGWCPLGRKAEDGVIPEHYQLIETRTDDYRRRTEINVQEADVTLIFIGKGTTVTGGSKLTAEFCRKHHKPFMLLSTPVKHYSYRNDLKNFLTEHKPRVINVAGKRESGSPGIQRIVKQILLIVLPSI
jgi:hypothetical protein